jgi:hypothetical protein
MGLLGGALVVEELVGPLVFTPRVLPLVLFFPIAAPLIFGTLGRSLIGPLDGDAVSRARA